VAQREEEIHRLLCKAKQSGKNLVICHADGQADGPARVAKEEKEICQEN
jgi:basic membrane lipoprotein Med (substrate-binding protein (PBP1-ABC) superfamily)